jgi:DNA-binding SARP family transcriptional activator/tetratricopeptide (TPR) repeat protein
MYTVTLMGGGVDFRVLGCVEVHDGPATIALGGPKPRMLLAALILHHGRMVPATRLVDVIWGDDPPATARALVQTYVAGLRKALGAVEFIATSAPGYVLQAAPEDIDLFRFERLADQGRAALARAAYEQARNDLGDALRLWRGPALSGVNSELLAGEAARLDELRLLVLEDRIEADLRLGRYEAVGAELTGLVRQYPTREGLRRQLMVALHRGGRQADALAVFREGRNVLIGELGIEPGPALRATHEAILRGDDAMPEPVAAAPGTVATAPAQLPAVPADFVGRAGIIRELVAALTPDEAPGLPAAVITGKGGVGKSTLAVRVGHELAPAYPDGQLFVQLHGMTTAPMIPEAVLGRFLVALGDPVTDLPSTLEGRSDRFRSLVAGRRVLVVLDDAADEQQVRPLLPGSPTCGVLITSRSRLSGLAGVHLTELDVLPAGEARELLARIAGPERIEAETEAADRLTILCGQLPLAVRIVATRLANRRHWTVGQLSARLDDERRRLDELAAGDQAVRATISLSYRALDDQARTALRRLGLLGLPDFPPWTIAALLDTDEVEAEKVIERLLDAQVLDFARVDDVGQVRYQLHDLLRLYAAERAAEEDDEATRIAAVRRVCSGWIHLVDRVGSSQPSGGIVLRRSRPSGQGWAPSVLTDALARPYGWFDAELHALTATVELAAELDLDDEAVALASGLCGAVFTVGNLFDAWTRTHDAALASVRRTGNRAGEAALLAETGQLRYEQDRFAEARIYLGQALTAFREVGDERGEATALAAIGTACREQGYLPEALHFLDRARAILSNMDEEALAPVERVSGSVRLELGDFPRAHHELQSALASFRATSSRRGEAMTLRTIGLVHRAEGDYAAALERSSEALAIFREIGDELLEAYSLRSMAKALIRLGRPAEALAPLGEVLRQCRAAGDRYGEGLTLRTLGELHLAEGRLAEADTELAAANRLWDVLDLPLARARTLRDLARVRRAAGGDPDPLYTEAAEIARLYGAREHAEILAEQAAVRAADAENL